MLQITRLVPDKCTPYPTDLWEVLHDSATAGDSLQRAVIGSQLHQVATMMFAASQTCTCPTVQNFCTPTQQAGCICARGCTNHLKILSHDEQDILGCLESLGVSGASYKHTTSDRQIEGVIRCLEGHDAQVVADSELGQVCCARGGGGEIQQLPMCCLMNGLHQQATGLTIKYALVTTFFWYRLVGC